MAGSIKELRSFGQEVLNDFSAVRNAVNFHGITVRRKARLTSSRRLKGRCIVEPALIYYERDWFVTMDKVALQQNVSKNRHPP